MCIRDRRISGLKVRVYNGDADAEAWNTEEVDLLLAHPASCGYGLNLQKGGHHIIWFSYPNWALEIYQQANKRLHRQGQTHPVIVHQLVVQGGMDEAVLHALHDKGDAQDAIMQALKARIEECKGCLLYTSAAYSAGSPYSTGFAVDPITGMPVAGR